MAQLHCVWLIVEQQGTQDAYGRLRIVRMLGVELQIMDLNVESNSLAPQRIPSVSDNAHDELLTVNVPGTQRWIEGYHNTKFR